MGSKIKLSPGSEITEQPIKSLKCIFKLIPESPSDPKDPILKIIVRNCTLPVPITTEMHIKKSDFKFENLIGVLEFHTGGHEDEHENVPYTVYDHYHTRLFAVYQDQRIPIRNQESVNELLASKRFFIIEVKFGLRQVKAMEFQQLFKRNNNENEPLARVYGEAGNPNIKMKDSRLLILEAFRNHPETRLQELEFRELYTTILTATEQEERDKIIKELEYIYATQFIAENASLTKRAAQNPDLKAIHKSLRNYWLDHVNNQTGQVKKEEP